MARGVVQDVEFALDKASVERLVRDAERGGARAGNKLGGAAAREAEGGFGKLESLAKRAGMAIAAAFAVTKIINFGRSAISEFAGDEAALHRLEIAAKRAGVAFSQISPAVSAASKEMLKLGVQESETAEILGTLFGRTGQVAASFENLQTVINLARRENMDFASATQVVANLMNGNVMRLKMLGISAKTAKDALAELRQETAGEASNWSRTFQGRLAGLSTAWTEMKGAIGAAMVEAGGGTSIMDTLVGAVVAATKWVEENHRTINEWGDGIQAGVAKAWRLVTFLVDDLPRGWREVTTGVAGMQRDLDTLSTKFDWAAGRMTLAFGRIVGLFSGGLLGQGIRDEGRRLMHEADIMTAQIDRRYKQKTGNLSGDDAGDSLSRIASDGGMLPQTGSGGSRTGVPRGNGTGGGRDAEMAAAAAKKAAADAKQAAEERVAAYNDTISAMIKLAEVEQFREESMRMLAFAEGGLKRQIADVTLSYKDRATAMARLVEVQEALNKARGASPLGDAADRALGIDPDSRAAAARTASEQRDRDIQNSLPTADDIAIGIGTIGLKATGAREVFTGVLDDMRNHSEDVAESIMENFGEAFDRMREEGLTLNSVLSNLGRGMAKSILGEIAKVAKGEAGMALANAIKFTAIGFGKVALHDAKGAGAAFASAKMWGLSAVKWGLLGGAMSALGGGGDSGGGGSGGGANDKSSVSDRMDKPQGNINIYLDGVDPRNPRHQALIGDAQRRYAETTGGQIVYHQGSRA